MKLTTRRDFFRVTGKGLVAVSLASTLKACASAEKNESSGNVGEVLKLGIASYTFRKFNLEETIAMTKRTALTRIAFKSFHLPLESTPDEIRSIAAKVRQAGLELYGCGVIYMNSEDEVNRAFNYAKEAGVQVIIGVPKHELLELVNNKVQKYNIKLAIHNHGPGDDVYPSPESAYERIKHMDPRMGLCLDIGHTKRLRLDPSEAAQKYAARLHDIHIKDVNAAAEQGKTVEIGRGVIDIPKFLQTLIKINYQGVVALEYEKDEQDPLPGVAESIGYLRGVLSVIS